MSALNRSKLDALRNIALAICFNEAGTRNVNWLPIVAFVKNGGG